MIPSAQTLGCKRSGVHKKIAVYRWRRCLSPSHLTPCASRAPGRATRSSGPTCPVCDALSAILAPFLASTCSARRFWSSGQLWPLRVCSACPTEAKRGQRGIEPRTCRTQSDNHTTRPLAVTSTQQLLEPNYEQIKLTRRPPAAFPALQTSALSPREAEIRQRVQKPPRKHSHT